MENKMSHSTTTIRLLNIDSAGFEEILLEKWGCFLKILSVDSEIWQLEFYDGTFLLGIGNPLKIEEYSQAIRDLFHLKEKDEFLSWLGSAFQQYGFRKMESLILRVEYTTRFTKDSKGTWRLFLPDETYYIGGPEQPYLPALSNDKLFLTVGENLHKFLNTELAKLYPDGQVK